MSQITTHILDTSLGRPAAGVNVSLCAIGEAQTRGIDETIAQGITNSDGRVGDLLADDHILPPGIYRLTFAVGEYYASLGTNGFYPYVDITFEIGNDEHYHVPLLLNPFGYSTYRGS